MCYRRERCGWVMGAAGAVATVGLLDAASCGRCFDLVCSSVCITDENASDVCPSSPDRVFDPPGEAHSERISWQKRPITVASPLPCLGDNPTLFNGEVLSPSEEVRDTVKALPRQRLLLAADSTQLCALQ